MNQPPSPARKALTPPRPAQAQPPAPAPARAKGDLATQRVLVRLSFASPVFGAGEHSWTFLSDAAMADELQQAMLDRRPIRLVFPQNTVVLDTTQIVLADFQPQS